jgi:SulP family sulfate permease
MPNGDRAVLLLTFALTVLVDLTVAIGVGVTLASLLFMAQMSNTVSIDRDDERDETEQRDALPDDVEVFRINGPFFFGVAAGLMDTYRGMGATPRVLILRLEGVPVLDASGAAAVVELVRRAAQAGTRVILCAARTDVVGMLERARIDGVDGRYVRTETFDDAIALSRRKTD